MRPFTASLALLATLAAAPVVLAQTAQPSTQGTIGTPANPGGGGNTMAQGAAGQTGTAPGAAPRTVPGTATTPGTIAPPNTSSDARPGAGTGATAPGTNSPPTTTTPIAGSNSFTEGQARSRIEAAGYSDVGPLTQDSAGVWRGRAMRSGASAEVGLDFQGNVVTGPAR